MIETVEIYSQNDLERICRNKTDFNDSILISIGNPPGSLFKKIDEKIPSNIKKSFKRILRLEFNDGYEGDLLPNGKKKKPPKKEDVKKAISFFEKYKKKYKRIVIHCWAGTSRSTAIGIGILYKIYKDEDKVINVLKEIRPYALPHKAILDYIDELCNTNFKDKRNAVLMNYQSRIKKEIKKIEDDNLEEL
jgi:predicted protein tyrosine phosphatase